MLTGFQPGYIRLPRSQPACQLGLRHAVLGAVGEHPYGDVVGELRAVVLTLVLRVAHVLLVDLGGGSKVG
jgi:hypothetical protein